jgi:hypothetical protein
METKYYNYYAKNYLETEMVKEVVEYNKIYIFAYEVITTGKYPFLRILLTRDIINALTLPTINIYKKMTSQELINYSKVNLFGLLMQTDFEIFKTNIEFNGFTEFNNNLYLFMDITKCKMNINDIFSTNNLWMTLIDEIVNHKHLCNIDIDNEIIELLTLNEEFCFLLDENNEFYEIPQVSYVGKPENKLNFTYVFGETKGTKNDLFGAFYYFTDYFQAYNYAKQIQNDENNKRSGIVRFAIFVGHTCYFENNIKDDIDESEIKQQRLKDNNLDQNIERLTIRISDHDGKWSDKGFDSAYLGSVELDNGQIYKKTILAIKEYEQQIPLSYHFIQTKNANNYSIL